METRIATPSGGDAASVVDSEASAILIESSQLSTSTSTVSTVMASSLESESRVGEPRDFSGHASGTTTAYNSVEKWVLAALRKLGKTKTNLVLPTLFAGHWPRG